MKTKTFPILTSNETVIIPGTQRNSDFLEPPRELMKLLLKTGQFVKLRRLTEERETTFGLSYREDRKTEAPRNQDSTVVILKHCILLAYEFNRQPGKIRNL